MDFTFEIKYENDKWSIKEKAGSWAKELEDELIEERKISSMWREKYDELGGDDENKKQIRYSQLYGKKCEECRELKKQIENLKTENISYSKIKELFEKVQKNK